MQGIRAETAVLVMLAIAACSDPSAPREDIGSASMAQRTVPIPLLGELEAGWRLPTVGDLNLDGMHDLVWRDHSTNRFAVWLLRGTQVLEQRPLLPGPPHPDWGIVSAGADFNHDGMSDVLWYNWTTNRAFVSLMAGTDAFEQGPEFPGPPGEGWYIAPSLDFNGDGISDLLWYNWRTNRMTVWLMRGTQPFEHGPEIPGPPGENWLVRFGAAFDRDALSDVFWHNLRTNRMAVWLMDGTTVRERGPEIPTPSGADWILAAAGDFNLDAIADVLWFNTRTKRITISLMYGTGLLEQSPEIPGPPGDGWIVGNALDCNGDGISDVIWLNTNPLRIRIWLMNGTVPMLQGPDIPGPAGG